MNSDGARKSGGVRVNLPTKQGDAPATLDRAHAVVGRRRPHLDASVDQWRAFYEYSARVYFAVAQRDDRHHFEALAYAGLAQQDAEQLRDASHQGCSASASRDCR